MRTTMVMPSQNALKLPAMRPDKMLSEAPPSREEVTTSLTWLDSVDVKILTSSGMIAPASVPHVMTVESFHHRSEEHTSELQSHSDLVCRLLLEKKKQKEGRAETRKVQRTHV